MVFSYALSTTGDKDGSVNKNQDGQQQYLHNVSQIISICQLSEQAFVVSFWREVAQMLPMQQVVWPSYESDEAYSNSQRRKELQMCSM